MARRKLVYSKKDIIDRINRGCCSCGAFKVKTKEYPFPVLVYVSQNHEHIRIQDSWQRFRLLPLNCSYDDIRKEARKMVKE